MTGAASKTGREIVRFDCYEADLSAGVLRKRGLRLPLRDQAFQVLAALLERPGDVITRGELFNRLWHGEITVDFENNLNAAIARLRQVLSDSAERSRFIETLPRRGYRFVGQVYSVPVSPETQALRGRLLVLPFVNLSVDPAQECFSDAITDELITAIAAVAPQRLAVIARTTAMHYKGTHKDVGRIGRELAVDYVVEGGMSRSADGVAINVQLIHSHDQAHLFARKYVGSISDSFHLQNRIVEDLMAQIPGLRERERTANTQVGRRNIGTDNLGAYYEYIQGRYHVGKATSEDLNAAKAHLERAIARDPEFAAAYDALAELYWHRGYFGMMRPREAFSAGIVHALRALEIDSARAETHALLGQFHKTVEYNWTEVHREMQLALQLDPASPLVRTRHAVSELMPHARLDEATAQLECALEVDPLAFFPRLWLGLVFMLQRRYERGLVEARKLLELDPNYIYAYFMKAMALHYLGKGNEAIAAQRRVAELSSGGGMLGWLGLTLAANGQATEARVLLRRLHAIADKDYVPPTAFAWIHLGLGEMDEAFAWLDRAVDECDQLMMPIKSYGFFEPIRSDPRFIALLRKMKLET